MVQRRRGRVAADIKVYWGRADGCPPRDRIISLCVGGCFLRTGRAATPGRAVFFKLWLPDERTPRGGVRYRLERAGVGVEFKGLSAADEASHLAALVGHYRESSRQ